MQMQISRRNVMKWEIFSGSAGIVWLMPNSKCSRNYEELNGLISWIGGPKSANRSLRLISRFVIVYSPLTPIKQTLSCNSWAVASVTPSSRSKERLTNSDLGLDTDTPVFVNEHLCPSLKRTHGKNTAINVIGGTFGFSMKRSSRVKAGTLHLFRLTTRPTLKRSTRLPPFHFLSGTLFGLCLSK